MKKTDQYNWEEAFDKKFNFDSYDGCCCTYDDGFRVVTRRHDLVEFIRQLLLKKEQELVEKIERKKIELSGEFNRAYDNEEHDESKELSAKVSVLDDIIQELQANTEYGHPTPSDGEEYEQYFNNEKESDGREKEGDEASAH